MYRANGHLQVQHTIAEDAKAPFVEIQTVQRTRFSINRHNHRLMQGAKVIPRNRSFGMKPP